MILDPKTHSLHSDYGSFDKLTGSTEGDGSNVDTIVDGSHSGMAQSSDVYQRQPLLPSAPTKSKDKWGALSSSSSYYNNDKIEELNHGRLPGVPNGSTNGIVKLDIPAPLRDEPRYPKEKWKTLIGKFPK